MAAKETPKLCSNCKVIDIDKLSTYGGYVVARNWSSLERSACDLCQFMKRAVDWEELNYMAPLSLFLKRHNPNCPDNHGAAELELKHWIPPDCYDFSTANGRLLATLGVYVEPGKC
jgi:hypothetical protein